VKGALLTEAAGASAVIVAAKHEKSLSVAVNGSREKEKAKSGQKYTATRRAKPREGHDDRAHNTQRNAPLHDHCVHVAATRQVAGRLCRQETHQRRVREEIDAPHGVKLNAV
jgi:hypothetical protein